MSFKLGLNRLQEILVMGLMLILVFALFSNMEMIYKVSIGAMVFTLIFLTSIVSQILKQAEDRKKF